MADAIEQLRQNPVYGPLGVMVGAGLWYGLRHVLCKIQTIDIGELMNSFLAIMFSGMYILMWVLGDDPHSGEFKPTELPFEIPLLLAGGVYLLNLYPFKSVVLALHSAVAVTSIVGIMLLGEGDNIGIVMSFFFHLPAVFLGIRCVLKGRKPNPTVMKIIGYLTGLCFLVGIGGLSFTTYQIIMNDSMGILVQSHAILYTLLSMAFVSDIKQVIMGGEVSGSRRSRSRSNCRSKSRSRSRKRRRC